MAYSEHALLQHLLGHHTPTEQFGLGPQSVTVSENPSTVGGNNGILAIFHFPVRKSITVPPRGPPWAAGMCIILVMPAVPKLLWATPRG